VSRPKLWYSSYSSLRQELNDLRDSFVRRCGELSLDPDTVLEQVSRDIIARIVFESNWQEGIHLDRGRTKELAQIVFEDFDSLPTPHVDFTSVLNYHRQQVLALKRKHATREELAAYNLSVAHRALTWVLVELANREIATLGAAVKSFEAIWHANKNNMPPETQKVIERGFQALEKISNDPRKIWAPLTGSSQIQGEVFSALMQSDFEKLLHPLRISHVHFLHRLTMMGTYPANHCGVFRKSAVHVDNPDIYFPPASAVPSLMDEFCREFPSVYGTAQYDRILAAAKASFRFVRIHPYLDGNGRLSRLLMNLVLRYEFPPVYIKADKKGRHRYSQALRRADRGDLLPLACLMTLSMIEVYKKIIASISRPGGVPSNGSFATSGASRIARK
jgi:fido (protein-threonine AMPylation protein)